MVTKYQYLHLLDQAIESFTRDECEKDPKAFYYRGVDLRFAIERHLYFNYCNGDHFLAALRGGSDVETDHYPEFCLARNMGLDARKRINKIKYLYRKIYSIASSLKILIARESEPIITKGTKYLFYVEQEKFIHYFNSFAHLLDGKMFFLTNNFRLRSPNCAMYNTKNISFAKEKRKGQVRYFPQIASEFDEVLDTITKISPDVVVLPEGNSPRCELVNKACRLVKIPTVCVQYGWSPIVHTGFRNMSYTSMFVWGDGFKKILEPYNPQQKFVVTGHPNLDKEISPQKKEGNITFFLPSNREFIQFDRIIESEYLEEFYGLILQTAKIFPNNQIIVRNHPSAPLSQEEIQYLSRENIVLHDSNKIKLSETLDQTSIAITSYSTTILECSRSCIPTIIFNNDKDQFFVPKLDELHFIRESFNKDDIIYNISYFQNNNIDCQSAESFRKEFFYECEKPSIEKIAETLSSIAEANH